MCGAWSKMLLGAVLGAAVLLALTVAASRGDLASALEGFDARLLAPALALAALNYALRFVRWRLYLRRAGVRVRAGHSAVVFGGGLAMSATPGKIGELVKAAMLRDEDRAPLAATVPVIVAERVADLAAVAMLAGAGLAAAPAGRWPAALAGATLVGLVAAVLLSPRLLRRSAGWLEARAAARIGARATDGRTDALRSAGDVLAGLLRGRLLIAGVGLGVLAWLAECAALWLIVAGLGWQGLTAATAVAIYAVATLAGALSMLPGGLGVTEVSMAGLLVAAGAGHDVAVAATVLVRLCTLWFAVALGVTVYLAHRAARLPSSTAGGDAGGVS